MLASSIALVVLSSAAEVGGGEGLLRGHVFCYLVQSLNLVVCSFGSCKCNALGLVGCRRSVDGVDLLCLDLLRCGAYLLTRRNKE